MANEEWVTQAEQRNLLLLGRALASLVKKEFGHILQQSEDDAWLKVGCAMAINLQVEFYPRVMEYVVTSERVIELAKGQKMKAGHESPLTVPEMTALMKNPAIKKLADKLQEMKSLCFQLDVDWDGAKDRLDKIMSSGPSMTIYECVDYLMSEIRKEHVA